MNPLELTPEELKTCLCLFTGECRCKIICSQPREPLPNQSRIFRTSQEVKEKEAAMKAAMKKAMKAKIPSTYRQRKRKPNPKLNTFVETEAVAEAVAVAVEHTAVEDTAEEDVVKIDGFEFLSSIINFK